MLTGIGAGHGPEPELNPALPNLGTLLRARGYEVAYKGKWHLTRPLTGAWGPADAERLGPDWPGRGAGRRPTVPEGLRPRPTAHRLMSPGMTLLLGPLRDDAAKREFVRFYASLQRLVDRTVGRLVAALGAPGDPASLRSR